MAESQFCEGITMPSIGLGTWEATDDAEIETAINAALEIGYRHIDTAYAYENERAVGKVLNEWINSGKLSRDELFVTTKLPIKGINSNRVDKYMKLSLENLGLDYVDLYLIHFPVGVTEGDGLEYETHDHEGVWKKMEEQVDEGRTKAIGLSNFNSSQIDNILKFARIKPLCNQVELHIFMQLPDLVQYCQSQDIIVVAYSPIANPGYNNFLTKIGVELRTDLVNVLTNPVIAEIARKYNRTNVQVALRFLVQQNIVVIPKSVKPERLRENFDIFSFSIEDEDMEKLKSLDLGEEARVIDWRIFPGIEDHPDYPFNPK